MARIRTIKPETWTDAKIVRLSAWARLLFIGMWNFADDEGCIVDEPATIRLLVLPADPVDPDELIAELVALGLLERWRTAEGRPFLRIRHFLDHQRIQHPTPSKLLPGAELSRELMRTHELSLLKGKEGNGT